MKAVPRYPALYEVNTRVVLTELSRALERSATLDDIPDADLDHWAELGFDWIWLLSVWQTGLAGQQVSRGNQEWRREFQATLPDLSDADITGSGFAIAGYAVHSKLGGEAALARLRERLRRRGLRLMLDFVPNHVALDHPWVEQHPDYFIQGSDEDLSRTPQNYCRLQTSRGVVVLAYGRDPYFAGWPDTLQLDYSNPATQQAMINELQKAAGQCDGVRCDMAMLVIPEIFERTWGRRAPAFWPEATRRVHQQFPDFCFMAEVYWDLEWTMQQQGFNYAYDKRLYDWLRDGHARPVREHLCADLAYQDKLARFMENHDEPRASVTFPRGMHEAVAIITYLSPGLRFFHQGQFEGRRKRISPHLSRAPCEQTDANLQHFYRKLMDVLHSPLVRDGNWHLVDCLPAWEGNWTYDCFIACTWHHTEDRRLLIAVNYAPNQSQCYIRLPFGDLAGRSVQLADLMGSACYERAGNELLTRGLYLDVAPWAYHAFEVTAYS
jgi:Alpha amylase, catalytic domain